MPFFDFFVRTRLFRRDLEVIFTPRAQEDREYIGNGRATSALSPARLRAVRGISVCVSLRRQRRIL